MKFSRFLILALLAGASRLSSAEPSPKNLAVGGEAQEQVMVTVYNNNYGLVREVRKVNLPEGTVALEFRDVAEKIDATSVAFKSQTAPGKVAILEQNYRYDLLNPQTLLEKYVGKKITLHTQRMVNNTATMETAEGTLLSTNGGNIVQFGNRLEINPQGSISVGTVPENLVSHPTLVWLLKNNFADEQKIETSYLTNDMNWKADYVAIINPEDTKLDLTGWVTLENKSGASYRDAKLKLVAGDVQRVAEARPMPMVKARGAMAADMAETQFAEKSFFEYHLYTLDRPATLANNETKQMVLLQGSDVPLKKTFVLDSPAWNRGSGPKMAEKRKLAVMLEFENKKENHLGIALPKGRVRAYKADTDASLQLVGEDAIDHTPRDEKLRIKLGEAFDVVAERVQSDYRQYSEHSADLSYSVTVRNHKEEAIQAVAVERAFGDWKVIKESQPHYKRDSQTLEFTFGVPPNGETVLTYTVHVEY